MGPGRRQAMLRPQTSGPGAARRCACACPERHRASHRRPDHAQCRSANAVRLEFAPNSLVQSNLSGRPSPMTGCGWRGDEACGVDRLRRLTPVGAEALRFGEVRDFPLASLLDLPGADDEEADLEGMAVADGHLWVVGSHGLKRKNAKPDRDAADNAKRLAKVSLDGNRRLLACLPIERDAQGEPCLVRQAADGRKALRLKGDAQSNLLTRALADDPTSARTWPFRARTTASTSRAWPWTAAGCCWACAPGAARLVGAARGGGGGACRRPAAGAAGRPRHADPQTLPAAGRPGRARPALLRRRPVHPGRPDHGAERGHPRLQVARGPPAAGGQPPSRCGSRRR